MTRRGRYDKILRPPERGARKQPEESEGKGRKPRATEGKPRVWQGTNSTLKIKQRFSASNN